MISTIISAIAGILGSAVAGIVKFFTMKRTIRNEVLSDLEAKSQKKRAEASEFKARALSGDSDGGFRVRDKDPGE